MKISLGITAALVVCFALVPAETAPAKDAGGLPFQLVYNSDTRGYYRPCG